MSSIRSLSSVSLSECQPSDGLGQKSHQNVFGQSFDPHRYRVLFPDRWAEFLRQNYRNSVEVAFNFDVTDQTATNWLNGTSRPTGDKVALAAAVKPAEFAKYLGTAA